MNTKIEDTRLFSVAALVFCDSKVLAVSRKTNHSDLGLPGGKIDAGETPEEALVRELREETGVTAIKFRPVFEDPCRTEGGESRPARVYLVEAWEGEPTAIEDAVVEWVLPERLFEPTNSFCHYNIALFKHLYGLGLSMNAPRKPEEIINSFPKNLEEAQIVREHCLIAFQGAMASNDHNELELYIMHLEKIIPLLHESLNLKRANKNDIPVDPDMEITRVDVPRSKPSWPIPENI
jgi:mutator protein MutT